MLSSGSQLVLAFAASLAMQTADAAEPSVTAEAQARFDAIAAIYPAVNATVMVNGEIVWEAEGGTMPDPADGVEQDYNVYSVAKMMLALAYLRLSQETGLDLDTPVRDIDRGLPEHYSPVTLRHLLEHRAGVRHYTSASDWISFSERRCRVPADALEHFIDDPLSPPQGDETLYSTFGYVLLSHLLVRITGEETFDAAMMRVLGGAYRAHTDHEGADKSANWVELGNGLERAAALSAECKFGGGGLLAGTRDLAGMLDALSAGDIVDLAVLSELNVPWAGYSSDAGMHYAAHSGGSPGGRAYMFGFIEPRVSVAVAGNADGPNFYELSLGLARLFSGLEEPAGEQR